MMVLARQPRLDEPVNVRRDLSREYAQVSVYPDGPERAILWVESAALDLTLTLSPAQVALLAMSAVQVALGPVERANVEQCWHPRAADRSPEQIDAAYRSIIAAVTAYHEAVTGRAAPAAN
jgi:hypothetical protein